ncbi:MAG TPA: PPOX class F420-dependent oxidoreductase [Nitrososphaeraceae archaeon]
MTGMQNDKRITSVEIVDVPPGETENNVTTTANELAAGATQLTKEEVYQLFNGRNLAFVSTLSKDGSPHVTPVWADMENDMILINTSEAAAKKRNVSRDPRIAISVVEQYNPYNMVSIKGRVIEQTFDGADEHLHKLAKKYLGIGKYYYRQPKHRRVILKVKPEKIMGLSLHPAFYFLAYSPYRSEIADT